MISIKELNKDRLGDFFQYLKIHLSKNGEKGTTLFQPLSKQQSTLSNEWKAKFEDGMNEKVGWRKIWVAINEEEKIVGHIDIRSQNQSNAEHRVLLGMGVDSNFRNLKIGQNLLEFIIDYCKVNRKISWIDLQVLTNNIPATRLYKKMNFEELSITKDMFRIDNISYDYTSMTLNVEN
ncbi:N-acetyltransferase [Flavobacterium collinsii]|uniref:GNAT family N-acetyltransferase n=1 Tax=Flavobacterium collinsii TaxID=1114861 RepID=UPI0022C4FCA8|nr:GNAT family N-acetyltransferase [Flavobacterium collinsii]GIQ60778.1 N-acetyltransferase [Flavobacterium collinsii]